MIKLFRLIHCTFLIRSSMYIILQLNQQIRSAVSFQIWNYTILKTIHLIFVLLQQAHNGYNPPVIHHVIQSRIPALCFL